MKTKLTVICLLLFMLCTVSTVCAADVNDTQITQEIDASSGDALEASRDDAVLAESSDELQKMIDNASEGSTVVLNKDYRTTDYIKIEKILTVDGAGHTIETNNHPFMSSSGEVTLKNFKFIDGNSNTGGSVFITGSAKFTIINCTFINNRVGNLGGAIYNNNPANTLTVINSTFNSNFAGSNGGAIYSKGNVVVTNSVFNNNTVSGDGGAILGEKRIEISNSVFNSNRATTNFVFSMSYGGAVKAKEELLVDNSNFTQNSAAKGGALFAYKDITIEKSTFTKNTAKEGGAVHVSNDNNILIEKSVFTQNSATDGDGGAVLANKWVHIGNSTFIDNKASSHAGAVRSDYIQFSGKNSFINNSANDHGGAVYTNTIGHMNTNLEFSGNHVDKDFGGAIYINKKSGDVTFKNSVFKNNHAIAGDGGAIYSDSSSTNLIIETCIFTGNYATGGKEKRYGGAIRSCANIRVDNSTFKDNWAENYGGAIYTETFSELKNSVFISNQVKNGDTKYGGAIYVNKACTMVITGNYFESNGGAAERGGILYTDSKNAHLKINGNAFIENKASDEGQSVFNKGYYDDVSSNWWALNSVAIPNQLKEYHTFGSNEDKDDPSKLVASLSGDKTSYVGVRTPIKILFTNNVAHGVLDRISYSSDKKGSFVTKIVNGNSLELIYIPNETGVHKLDFTINFQKLSYELNVSYISVYGYDLNRTYGDDKYYSAVFKDKNGNYLPNDTVVSFQLDGKTYSTTVSNGTAILYTNIEAGTHTVKAINNVTGESFTNKIIVKPRNAVYNMLDEYFVKIDDAVNQTVTFKVAGKTFNSTVMEGDIAYFVLNVPAGNHTVEIIYNNTVIKDQITVLNKYSSVDLGLKGTSYGALLPIYANETFIKLSNASMYSVIGENTYRYILGSGDAFILYNVTVSNTEELTKVLRKMAGSDYKVDVTQINLKKNTYKVTENFWRDSEWNYLIHLTHGKVFINGGGSTLQDDYHHNFISLEPNTNIVVNNLTFYKFYRVFASSGEVSCENVNFVENNAKFFATTTPGSVIYNKNKATFKNCIFKGNDNSGSSDAKQGGVLYADAGSITNFIKCQFQTKDDDIRAVDKSMVVIYDDNWNTYQFLKENSEFGEYASFSLRHIDSYQKESVRNFDIKDYNGLQDLAESIRSLNVQTSYNVTLHNGQYTISDKNIDELTSERYEWRSAYIDFWRTVFVHERSFLDINTKPVVINGNGATITMTGNSAYNDYHFAYIPKYGSLTLINVTLSGFNTAILNYGTFIAINCTFTNNIMHHRTQTGDFGGAIRNYGNLFCYNSTFKDNGANKGGAVFTTGKAANAVFSNCTFTGNVIKSNYVWKNNDKNDFAIEDQSVVKFVHCKGVSASTITTEKNGLYLYRDNLNNSVLNVVIDSLAALVKVSKLAKNNDRYDVINATFVKGEYGVFPDSKVLFEMDFGVLILHGEGAKVFVQGPKDSDTTQFLTTTVRSTVQIDRLTIQGFNIAIKNSGTLTITNSVFDANRVDYNFKADYGGAIVNEAFLNVFNSTFIHNYAKYGGAIYNTGTTKVFMSLFSDNTGYNSKSKVDIYNKDASVEDIVIYGGAHSILEKHPMASWKKDLISTGFLLATLVVTANFGWAISATNVAFANFIAMGANALAGGAFGALEGWIYAEDNQDYSYFWASVLKGVSRGIQYSPIGSALNGIKTIVSQKYIEYSFNVIYTKFIQKSVDLAQKVAQASAKGNYNSIIFYSMVKGMI